MVNFWENELLKGIQVTKDRIKFCEKFGKGNKAMFEKNRLKKQERQLQLRKEKQ